MLIWFYPMQVKKGIQARTLDLKGAKAIFLGLLHNFCGRYGRYTV